MEQFNVSKIFADDAVANKKMDILLSSAGLRRDANLDYSCGIYNENDTLIATGSSFLNTLRCLAVSSEYKGDGLMNIVLGHLIENQRLKSISHTFLYTKASSGKFFKNLGFYEIIKINNSLSFMENKPNGFSSYLKCLSKKYVSGKNIGAIVMNANPFTLGHLALIEKASTECDFVHLFIVSEDSSIFPFEIRKKLVQEGTQHLSNIIYHDTGNYIISNSTFPAYFQKDHESVIQQQALLDISIFNHISVILGITHRYVGDEPYSIVTGIYNNVMQSNLPLAGIKFCKMERIENDNIPISASHVRTLIKQGLLSKIKSIVPQSTYDFIASDKCNCIRDKIKKSTDVIHY